MVWLDVETEKISKQIFIETPEFGYAHFARSSDGYIVLAGSYDTPKSGSQPLLSVINPDMSIRALQLPDNSLRGEALSLYLNETEKLMVTTLPVASKVQIWNYQSGRFLRQIEIEEPRGLAHSTGQNKLLVSSARTNGFMALDSQLALRTANPFATSLGGSGSHLYRLKI